METKKTENMKQLNITLLLTLLMSMVGAKALAYDAKINGIYYNFSGTNATVTYYSNSSENNRNAYSGNVVIPESVTYNGTTYSVTSIGNEAFEFCYGLTGVTIPNSVTSIKYWAFWNCSGLTSVTIPNSLTSIGERAFYGCKGKLTVNCNIPNASSSSNSPFRGSLFSEVQFSSDVTSIGNYAFYECSGLTSVTIPNSVTSIGNNAFSGCSGLTSVTIPTSVTSIGSYAFYDCSSLTSVTIPNSVVSIGNDAFSGTAWYNNQPDGLVYAGKVAYKYKGTMPANTSISLLEGTLGIAGSAFEDCSSLTSVTIPNSVTSIGTYAFGYCI